jgi:hypothetical protein
MNKEILRLKVYAARLCPSNTTPNPSVTEYGPESLADPHYLSSER